MMGRPTLATRLPKGTITFSQVWGIFGVSAALLERQIGEGHIEVTAIGRYYRYLTPDQQRKAMQYWDECGVKYRKPVSDEESEASS